MTDLLSVVMLSLVEGITEFLPISSTGHLILFSTFVKVSQFPLETFEIAIQSGAILAIVSTQRDMFSKRILPFVCVSSLPILIVGYVFHSSIKQLFTVPMVIFTMILGGVLMLITSRMPLFDQTGRDVTSITFRDALWIGIGQVFAVFPGTSRSAATLLPGIWLGLSRTASARYSFAIGFPVIFAATAFELATAKISWTLSSAGLFLLGMCVSYFSAKFTMRLLLKYLNSHSIEIFGWYRLLLGGILSVFILF